MFPADVVLGSVSASGVPTVDAYKVTDYIITPDNKNGGWTTNMGVVKSKGNMLVCFSRPISSVSAAASPVVLPADVHLIWAASPKVEFEQHSIFGSLGINMEASAGGSALLSSGPGSAVDHAGAIAHGVLMVLAFMVLMPGAVLAARYKWLHANKEVSKGYVREERLWEYGTGHIV
jgi:hypothetical protein